MRRLLLLGSLAVATAPALADGGHTFRTCAEARAEGYSNITTMPALADGGQTFRTCAEAREAGHSNIRRGSHGYGPHLDRDGDGIACES